MRLADFIVDGNEDIVADWVGFARTLQPAADGMGSLALRDHVDQILQAVAKDLRTYQSPGQQLDKSKGQARQALNAQETAAQTHAVLRARSGFDIKQLAAEYRALRASVLRLWSERYPVTAATDFDDVIRFNEAIDQALAESVDHFSAEMDQARNLMLGMLGHDMRSPLQAIQMTAKYLAVLNAGEQVSQAASRLIRSGARMQTLLDDLLDFNRIKLGAGIRMEISEADLAAVANEAVRELRAAYPGRELQLQADTQMAGAWDVKRMQQLFSNLIVNALTHGAPDEPVDVTLTTDSRDVRIQVLNRGAAIDPAELAQLFEPLYRGAAPTDRPQKESGLGLGLYIASEIAKGHGGRIEVKSDETATVFTVWLPRQRPKAW